MSSLVPSSNIRKLTVQKRAAGSAINLSGKWLAESGFPAGVEVAVVVEDRRLVIVPAAQVHQEAARAQVEERLDEESAQGAQVLIGLSLICAFTVVTVLWAQVQAGVLILPAPIAAFLGL